MAIKWPKTDQIIDRMQKQPAIFPSCIGCPDAHSDFRRFFFFFFLPRPVQKSPQNRSKNENVILGGKRAFFIFSGEKPFLKYPKLTGITSKITYPTLHLGEKVRCRLAFLAIFGPFRGHSSAKISPNGPKSPPNISYGWTLMVFAQKI